MGTPTLPLGLIVDVSVQINPQGVAAPKFNQALIIGPSAVIPNATRCVLFQGSTILAQMVTYGFSTTSPEYLAAQAYMAQTPQPQYLWIGLQDPSSIKTFAISGGNAGTGYVVGDQFGVVGSPAGTGGVGQVTSISAGGVVTGIALVAGGTGYSVAAALSTTTTGAGTGLKVSTLTIGETSLQAVTACRNASPSWYLAYCIGAAKADNIAVVTYAQSASPQMQYFFNTSDSDALSGAAGNVFSTLKASNFNRYQGTYITTQGGAATGNTYFGAGLMGVAMGRNTGLNNSYFILPFKPVVGMTPEPLSPSQVATINGINGNVYVNYANSYDSYTPGVTGNGQYFDQILGLDMLAADLQFGVANALFGAPAIPMTNSGQSTLIHAANKACQLSANRGFISTGIWDGPTVLNLESGDTVISGFLNQSDSYANQTAGARANRQAMPIYTAVVLTEGAQSILIGVFVQQ